MTMIHLLVGSTLGAAEYVAEHIEEKLQQAGYQTRMHYPAQLDNLAAHDGDIPDNLQPFAHELAQQTPDLSHCFFAVVGLGDSNYDTFCEGGKKMEQLLDHCRAIPLGERFDIDVTQYDIPEDAADLWLTRWLPLLPSV